MTITALHLRKLFFILVLLLCFTFLRKILVLFYPFIVLVFFYLFRLKLTPMGFLLVILIIVHACISSAYNGFWVLNNTLSLYLILPTVVLCLSKPKRSFGPKTVSYIEILWKYSTVILLVVNLSCIGTFLYTHFQHSFISPLPMDILDDSFYGLYGKSGLGSHTLSLINTIYAIRFLYDKKIKLAIVFFIFAVLGFYGLGFLLTLLSLIWVFRSRIFNIKNIKIAFAGILLIIFSVLLIKLVNPQNYDYIKNTLTSFVEVSHYDYKTEMEKANKAQTTQVPRKVTFLVGSLKRLKENPSIFILGTSPGTYNSRAAYLLNGDLSKTNFLRNNFSYRPPFHEEDIFPLYNTKTLVIPWMGGTRNQPFSSIVSILMEYGFVSGLIIIWLFLWQSRKSIGIVKNTKDFIPLKFITIFSLLLFFFVYYFEVLAYMIPILLLYKVYELDSAGESPLTREEKL